MPDFVSASTAHVGESLSGTDISQQSSLPRIPSAPSMDRHTSPRVSQKVSPQSLRSSLSERPPSETVIRYSESVLLGRALSKTEVVDAAPRVSSVRIPSREESVGRTAETPERHTSPRISPRMSPRISPRVSPQSSLARIPSAPSMEEPLVTPSAAVGRVSTARSGVSLGMSLGISAANVVGPVCFKDVSQIMPTTIPGYPVEERVWGEQQRHQRDTHLPEYHQELLQELLHKPLLYRLMLVNLCLVQTFLHNPVCLGFTLHHQWTDTHFPEFLKEFLHNPVWQGFPLHHQWRSYWCLHLIILVVFHQQFQEDLQKELLLKQSYDILKVIYQEELSLIQN
ncbi:unnamed protein product [Coregonus sp. 'balchen']|nr:unnamed protein product [Coregonus sp. 'balchen']